MNVDYSIGARISQLPFFHHLNKRIKIFNIIWSKEIFIHNLIKKFPWSDNTVDAIYSSHTLEHFLREDGYKFLQECHRVLKKRGIIRIVVPDLAEFTNKYIKGEIRADEFVENIGVLFEKYDNKIKSKFAPFIQFPHKCMYDTPTLVNTLKKIGFSATSKKPFESQINDIKIIELENRTVDAVIIEGQKQ